MGPKRKVEAIMAKVYWKGSTLLAPVSPTMVTCGQLGKTQHHHHRMDRVVNSQPPMTYISVRPSRYSYELLKETGEFVINLTPAQLVRQADWCGVRSGRDEDKFAACNLTPVRANHLDVPLIAECPVNLECRVKSVTPLGSHDMFLAEIVGVDIDEEYLDADGKLHMDRCGLACYMHGEYFEAGKKLGSFGYSVRKSRRLPRKSAADRQQKRLITARKKKNKKINFFQKSVDRCKSR